MNEYDSGITLDHPVSSVGDVLRPYESAVADMAPAVIHPVTDFWQDHPEIAAGYKGARGRIAQFEDTSQIVKDRALRLLTSSLQQVYTRYGRVPPEPMAFGSRQGTIELEWEVPQGSGPRRDLWLTIAQAGPVRFVRDDQSGIDLPEDEGLVAESDIPAFISWLLGEPWPKM